MLLHPTSLPGACGIGSFGPEARRFLNFLVEARQRLWQVCPLGPTGYADSPYQCFSAFAGNPMLIGLEQLRDDGLLEDSDLTDCPPSTDKVDFGPLIPWKQAVLQRGFEKFRRDSPASERARLQRFEFLNRHWLSDYGLFMALKEAHGGGPWSDWSAELRHREPDVLDAARAEHEERIAFHIFAQWLFFEQWLALRAEANAHGIRIVGDLPIFVAQDSADVWAGQGLFELDEEGVPLVVAGVPPDYFSSTGQLWGNPVYRWEKHQADDFAWWHQVLVNKLRMYDFVRVDHFRGFSAYWSVPRGETTAINGEWVPAPGRELFRSLESKMGRLPLIAEDLGVITKDVVELINQFGFPRMKVLQFAFDSGEDNNYLPHTYDANAVVYTGTHDNNTTTGWLEGASEADREYALRYVNSDGTQPHWDFIRAAIASTAQFAIVPAQDLLGLGSAARMNTPGTTGGNWVWRLTEGQLTAEISSRLGRLTETYGRS